MASQLTRQEMADSFSNTIQSGFGDREVVCEGFSVTLGDPLTKAPIDDSVPVLILGLFENSVENYCEFLAKIKPSDDFYGFQEREFRETQVAETLSGLAIALDISKPVPWSESES